MTGEEIIEALSQNSASQKETFDVLMKKYLKLQGTFEEVLVEQFAASELRDLETKSWLPTRPTRHGEWHSKRFFK